MKKPPPRCSPARWVEPLPAVEWDFSAVPAAELVACCYWEYARESAFIRSVIERCRDPRWREMLPAQAHEYLGNDLERIQSMGCPAAVVLAGASFPRGAVYQSADAQAPNYRHPDAPPITGSFPAPWQSLTTAERAVRARIQTDRERIPLVPFRRGDGFFAEEIARRYPRRRTDPAGGEGIYSSLYLAGEELGVFGIQWEAFTNEELVEGFRQWVKANRPRQFPQRSGQGHKPGDWRAQLTRLAVMRLLARCSALKIVVGNELPAVWEGKQFAGGKWADVTKWYDARREAGKRFRSLFPFLPAGEKPLSWKRLPPGK